MMKNRIVLHTKKHNSRVGAFLAALLCCIMLCQPTVIAKEEVINVTLNGARLKFDQNPIIESDRTLVPLRKIFESLNAIVEWNEETQGVYAKKGTTEVLLTIDSNIAEVNGKEYILDVPAKVVNGRTLVPARFVAESLGCRVDWNGDTNTVIIKSGAQLKDSENLYNIDTVTYDKYTALADQSWYNEAYDYSELIKVSAGTTLYFTEYRNPVSVRYVTAYDADKKAVAELGKENVNQYTVPEGIQYIRITSFAKNTAYLKVSEINETDGYIPEEICVASGRKITIYGNQLVSEKRDDLSFSWECEIGYAEGDNYVIEADSIGEYPITVTVTDETGKEIWTGNSKIKTVKNKIKNIKYLAIGDSLTNNKSWQKHLSKLSGGKIEFVGTRGVPYKHEGRSGFSASQYLTGSEYTFEKEGVHPFFDGERFNWNYYKETTGVNPDAVQIFLGINGVTYNPESNVSNIRKMIDYIRLDDADIPIFVVNTMYKGPKTNAEEHTKVFNLMEKLNVTLSDYENVYIVPIAITHDSETNYSENDQIHPMDAGYQQIADCIYSSICANME